jgi:hypothetical protein
MQFAGRHPLCFEITGKWIGRSVSKEINVRAKSPLSLKGAVFSGVSTLVGAALAGAPMQARAEISPQIAAVLKRVAQTNDYMPTKGAYARERAENLRARTLVLLKDEEKRAFGIESSALAFANFRDHEHFFVAYVPGIRVDDKSIPTSSNSVVSEVHAIQEHWAALTKPALAAVEAHTYLRFFFKSGSGVKLVYDQTTQSSVETSRAAISPAVLSIEAIRPASKPSADFMPSALLYDFAIGNLFYSQSDRDLWEKDDIGKVVDDFRLNLRASTSRVAGITSPSDAILVRSIQTSHNRGRSQTYNFVEDNCTNRLFDLLDNSITYGHDFDRSILVNEIKVTIRNNIAQQLVLLKDKVREKGKNLPPSALAELSAMTEQQIATSLVSAAETAEEPREFGTWIPPFVRPHLAARHLIKPSPVP